MKKQQSKGYLISLAKALIIMRGKTVEDIARETGIPQRNLFSFLGGVGMALSPEHAVKFFYALGIGAKSDGTTGFLSHCVHNLTVHESDFKLIEYLQPLLPEAKTVALPFSKRNQFPFLIRSGETRVSLVIRTKFFFRQPKIDHLWFVEGKTIAYKGVGIPTEYKEMFFSRQMGVSDFDALAQGVFPDWTLIRQIANSHGITYAEIREFLIHHSQMMRRAGMTPETGEVIRDFSLVYGTEGKGFPAEKEVAHG